MGYIRPRTMLYDTAILLPQVEMPYTLNMLYDTAILQNQAGTLVGLPL